MEEKPFWNIEYNYLKAKSVFESNCQEAKTLQDAIICGANMTYLNGTKVGYLETDGTFELQSGWEDKNLSDIEVQFDEIGEDGDGYTVAYFSEVKKPATFKEYELTILYNVEATAEEVLKVQNIIEDYCRIDKIEYEGKKRLAYPICNQDFALYTFYTVVLPFEKAAELSGVLNLQDCVLRYLLVQVTKK